MCLWAQPVITCSLEQAVKYTTSMNAIECSGERSGVFIPIFEYILHLVRVSIVNFYQVNAGWRD